MKQAFLRKHGKAGLELIEEAFVLLRTCPAGILASYFVGTVPFAAGFLIFCSDLSRHPEAPDRLAGATLAMTALFLWMKFFHARFAATLLARLRGDAPPSWQIRSLLRSASSQTIIQSTALFLLPLSALLALPAAWVYAFYQNVSTLDDGKISLRDLVRSAAQQCLLWPGQNHVVLLGISGFGLYVFLNWITLGLFAPQLLKILFGIESVFTQSPMSMLNTTFFTAMATLTFLSVDPLCKTVYVLRCFYGKSLQSGDDLKTEVRRLSGRMAALAACLFLVAGAPSSRAAEAPPQPTPVVAGSDLDQSISTVLQQSKYTWRSPKEKKVEKKDGLLSGFIKGIFSSAQRTLKAAGEFIEKILDWLLGRGRFSPDRGIGSGWEMPQLGLLFVIVAAVACVLAIFALRTIRARGRTGTVEGTALQPVPDLEDENTAADQLPEDDWSRMGRRFFEQGDLRLAVRAFYLSSLAHLASRSLITIARSKSNRDYERELRRRGHSIPELPLLFGENVGIFDRTWYGFHEVTDDLVRHFVDNLEKIKSAG